MSNLKHAKDRGAGATKRYKTGIDILVALMVAALGVLMLLQGFDFS